MSTNKIANIFDYLQYKEISLVHSIPFCLRLFGEQINDISKRAGVTRGYFYKVLAGERNPNAGIKQELKVLGINPWD